MDKKQYIEAGRIVNTHGVRGEVKIEVWLDSAEFLRSFKRVFIGEREIKIESAFVHKGFLIAKLEGVDDVNAAMSLQGARDRLHTPLATQSCPRAAYFIQRHYRRNRPGLSTAPGDWQACRMSWSAPRSNIYVVQGRGQSTLFPQYRNLLCQPMPRGGDTSPSGS